MVIFLSKSRVEWGVDKKTNLRRKIILLALFS